MLLRVALLGCVLAGCSGDVAELGPDAAGGDAGIDSPLGGPVAIADRVIASPGSTGTGYGDPLKAVNGIRGAGTLNGSLDVYSLRFAPSVNSSITLGWTGKKLANGPGADLAIFENGFDTDVGPFMDLVIVEVSRDGVTWRTIAHDYVTSDESVYVRDRAAWVGFGGKTPVKFDSILNLVDPFDPELAGGDALDLDNIVGDDAEAISLRAEGVTHVRLVTAPSRVNLDTGEAFVADEHSNGADIDGLIGRYVTPL